MAGSRKEYELLFKLQASLGGKFNSTFNSAVQQTKQLQNTLQSLNSVQKKVDGYKKQETAIGSNKDKLAALQEEHKRLQKQMAATEKPSDSLKEKLEKNARQIDQTTAKIREQEAQLGTLGSELRNAGVNTDNLEQSNQKLAKSYEAVQRSQEQIARISAAQQQNAQAISETKRELGKTVGVIAAVGTAIYAGPVRTAAEFEAQMSKVEAISGATADEMALIIAEAKRMGRTTKFTAVESGEALEYMAMAGWKTEQMLGGLEGIMQLAAASGEDLGTVSDIVTDALTAFGLQAEDSAHFADVLAAAAANSNTNVGMLGESFKYAAPLAGAFGFSVEDTAVLLGLMANSGIKASQGGTQLRKLFAALSSDLEILQADGSTFVVETANMDGSMRDLKDIIDDVRLAFNGMSQAEIEAAQSGLTEAAQSLAIELSHENGELKTQAELYDEVTEAVEGLTAAGKVQEAEAISGKTAMAGLLAIVNSSDADYEKLTQAIYNADGAAQQMSETMMDNYQGSLTLAKSALEGLQIAVGDALLPAFTDLMRKVTEVISKMAEFAEENPELTQTILKVAGALAGLKVAGLAGKLGFLELRGGFLQAKNVLALFKGNMAQASAEAVMGGGKIAGMGKTLTGYFSGVRDSLGGLSKSVDGLAGGKLGGLVSKISGGLQNGILKPFAGIGDKIGGLLGGAAGKITAPLAKIGQTIANGPLGTIAGKLGGVFQNLGGVVSSVLGGPLKGLGSLFGGLFGKAMPLIMIISALSMLFLKLSGEDISEFIEPLKQAFEEAKPVLQALMEQFQELGKQLLPMLVETAKKLAPLLGQIVAGLLPVLLELISAVVPIIMELVSQLLPVVLDIIGQLAPFLTDIITQILPIVVQLLQMLLPIITELITAILPLIVEVLNAILPLVMQLIEAVLPVLMSILQALMPVIEVLANLFSAVLGGAIEAIKPILQGLIQILTGIIDFVTGVFTGNWEQAWQGVKDIFGGVFSSLVELFKAPFRIIVSGINSLLGGLNKLKIPDWVPGIGGKGFNLPEIPMFAKGTPRTPDTFIAGENGAELVTNAKNRTVFTAAQTRKIMDNVGAAQQAQQGQEYVIVLAPALQALLSSVQASVPAGVSIPQAPTTGAAAPAVSAPGVSPAAVEYGGKREYNIKVENSPTLVVEKGDPEELKRVLEENNEKVKREIEQKQKEAEQDERRGEYE